MRTYPIMLDLRGKLAVVVGAGPVGLRKVEGLLEAEARVRLIDSHRPAKAVPEAVDLLVEAYRPEMLAGAVVVFACTDQPTLNTRIASDARSAGAWVNVADVPDECDFYAASVVRQGDVVVAIGTGGASPGLAAWLRRRLSTSLPQRAGAFAEALLALRTKVREAVPDDSRRRMDVMKRLVCDEAHAEFLADGPAALRRRLDELLRAGPED